MTSSAWIVGALRTPVAPRNGSRAALSAPALGAIVIEELLQRSGLGADIIDCCILGNALYGGGNPARVASLASGVSERVPGMTIDTQCCGGLDAINLAASLVTSGAYDVVLAGGIESYSTAPRRFRRVADGSADVEYSRPPFTPWPDRDPDMLQAAASLAGELDISRAEQEAFAQASHATALGARASLANECVAVGGQHHDSFTRRLTAKTCNRLPVIAGSGETGLTAATVAVEADAGAVCALVSSSFLKSHPKLKASAVQVVGGCSVGSDPEMPGLAPVGAVKKVLEEVSLKADDFALFEVMEAFAAQALACIRLCGFDPSLTNLGGGALARGHPIGASGAINAVRLFSELNSRRSAKYGLATIAGAGGLGTALVLSK